VLHTAFTCKLGVKLETDKVFPSVIPIFLFKFNSGAHKKQFIRMTAAIHITQMLNRLSVFWR